MCRQFEAFSRGVLRQLRKSSGGIYEMNKRGRHPESGKQKHDDGDENLEAARQSTSDDGRKSRKAGSASGGGWGIKIYYKGYFRKREI